MGSRKIGTDSTKSVQVIAVNISKAVLGARSSDPCRLVQVIPCARRAKSEQAQRQQSRSKRSLYISVFCFFWRSVQATVVYHFFLPKVVLGTRARECFPGSSTSSMELPTVLVY